MTCTLYAAPDSFNVVPEMVLEELGVAYHRRELDRASGEQRQAAYKKLNPQGLIPTLTDGDLTLFETAAICVHLAEKYRRLLPPSESGERSEMFKWLFFLSNTLHTDLRIFWYTNKYSHDEAAFSGIREAVRERVEAHLDMLEAQMEKQKGYGMLYLVSQHITIADFYLAHCLRCARVYPLGSPPLSSYSRWPVLSAWLTQMAWRRAVKTAYRNNGVTRTPLTDPRKPDAIDDPGKLVG